MTDALLQFFGFVLALVIFWRAESVLNIMAAGCRFLVRVAFWLLVVGAAWLAVSIWQGYTPPLAVLIPLAGTALLLVSERRVRAILRAQTPVKSERRIAP